MVIPINVIVMQLFRKSKPKDWVDMEDREDVEKALGKEVEAQKKKQVRPAPNNL